MRLFTKAVAVGAGLAGASYATYVATTWLGYGHPRRARGDEVDPLLDACMPIYDVCERHSIRVAAPADATFAAAKEIDLDGSRIVRAIFRAREMILRGTPEAMPRARGLVEQAKAIGWAVLAEDPGRELVIGAVTRPWEAHPVFRAVPDLATFAEPDYVKIAWTLRVRAEADGSCTFHTETRAVATDADARRKFRRYWAFLSPGIILIRKAMLAGLADAAERKQLRTIEHHAEPLPGGHA